MEITPLERQGCFELEGALRLRRWLILLVMTVLAGARLWAAEPPLELKVGDGTLIRNGKVEKFAPLKDFFGKGVDGAVLAGSGAIKPQLQWKCMNVPEGDYYPALLISSKHYIAFCEFAPNWAHLYLNDTRLFWAGHSAPVRPESAAEKVLYQAELRTEKIHVKPGDVLRVVYPPDGGHAIVGSLLLYKAPFTDSVVKLSAYNPARMETYWICGGWDAAQRSDVARPSGAGTDSAPEGRTTQKEAAGKRAAPEGRTTGEATQSCWLYNPGVLPRTFKVAAVAKDYLQKELLENDETITLGPGERITRTYKVPLGTTGRVRLSVEAAAEGVYAPLRLVKFYLNDVKTGPRPNSLCLNGPWEMCYVKGSGAGVPPADRGGAGVPPADRGGAGVPPAEGGKEAGKMPAPQPKGAGKMPAPQPTGSAGAVEPGIEPPVDAKWTKVVVPNLAENKEGHCIWLRKTFRGPEYIQGERIVLRFLMCMSESWLYVNGKQAHYQQFGTEPFEADIASAFKPGQENQILVAVRDWLAYSPKNRERVLRGEEPIFRDNMIAPAGYKASGGWGGCLGIGRPVYLEARPAVSVDDVFVVTSVRQKKLTLKYRIANKSGADQQVRLTPTILENGVEIKKLAEKTVAVKAGQSEVVTIEQDWPDAKLWGPGEPNLYVLQTDLKPSSGAGDRHLERFGWREMWIDGIHFVVNGIRMKIRSQWTSPASGIDSTPSDPERRLEDLWLRLTTAMLDRDTQMTRTHNMVAVEEHVDIADEVGLMVKVENGSTAQQIFTFDQGYWKQMVASELRVVDAYKNHPSVFMWSAGNENMWGWLYQGEAARTLGNRWQVKIAQAMRDFDLMARPIEWEADGDLMGKWEYHQTHYPREINAAMDIPPGCWWGPLDGKTVFPYSMGPITLGQKPIVTGESASPEPFLHPFGQTVIVGDDAYLGGAYQWKGWFDASPFTINAFRDAEFAVVDTYAPMWMQWPQTVVLKEETTQFFGGQKLVRHINVHNDVLRGAKLVMEWGLAVKDGGGELAHGSVTLDMTPAELNRQAVEIALPKVDRPTAMTLAVKLREGDKTVHVESRDWIIHPAPAIAVPQGLAVSLYDPEGRTAAMLTALKVPFAALPTLKAPAAGALIIGQDALRQPPQGPWREELDAFVRGGGKVLVLEQSETPDFLPFPLVQARKSKTTIAFARALDHPILAGLGDADLKWWADDHYVSMGNYRKPLDGNVVSLVDVGTMDGMLESPLLEEYKGKGSFILCQMMLTAKATTSPPAARLLQNILTYFASPAAYRRPDKTALSAASTSRLRKMLEGDRVVFEELSATAAPDQFKVILVDAATGLGNDGSAGASPSQGGSAGASPSQRLKAFAAGGGTVVIYRATPAQQPMLEGMLGIRLKFLPVAKEPSDVQNRIMRCTGSGLLGGISNHDFFWASKEYLERMRDNGKWWSGFQDRPPEEFIAEYYVLPVEVDAANAVALTRPCALLEVPCGTGRIVLSQLRLDEPMSDVVPTVKRLRSMLWTNLGCTIQGAAVGGVRREDRLSRCEFSTVDLSKYANRGLRDDKAKGIVGWTNQEENDVRSLPTGRQTFANVPFQIASPKAAIVLYSVSGMNRDLPKEVKGIALGRRADALFFLHALAYGTPGKAFRYRVNYADGSGVDVPIDGGKQVFDWWQDPAAFLDSMAQSGTVVAWRGDNPMRKGVSVLLYEWPNPSPEKEIVSVDFATIPENEFGPVPVLVGLTAATMRSDQGVVVDVLGTAGLKVRLGTQVTDVCYIGVAGLDPKHPFYESAVQAHKAMVLDKKVVLRDDVVNKNQAGQRLTYVFLAGEQEHNLNNLVNARMIGDGLGKLGNFEGNNRHRMYLENLGMIARDSRKGLWGREGK